MSVRKFKLKEKYCFIDFPVYGYRMIIIFTNSVVESRVKLSDKLGLYVGDLSKAEALHSYNPSIADSFLMFDNGASNGIIAHECFHAIFQMFNYYQIELGNELVAYHLMHMIDEIDKFLKNKKNGKG